MCHDEFSICVMDENYLDLFVYRMIFQSYFCSLPHAY